MILFLTSSWKNIDDNIRRGEKPGGVPSVAGIWEACHRQGYECHVFIMTHTEPGWPRKTEELDGITFHWMDFPLRSITRWLQDHGVMGLAKPLWFFWQLQFLVRILRSGVKPDVIYSMRTTFVFAGLILKWVFGAKLVLRMYGTFLYQYWFEQKNWMRRISNLGSLLAHRIPMDLLIMTNDGTRGYKVAEWIGFPMHKYRFWINGVNKEMRLKGFNSKAFMEENGIPVDSIILMTLGRLTFWKRIDRVIDAMPEVLKEVPNARLMIVGDGELQSELEQHAQKKGVSDSIIFVGAVPHHMIKEYLNACDIFIINNDLTNMCNTLIEALTAGCCVITRDIGATTDIVTNDINACVMKTEDVDNIAAPIIDLCQSTDKRKALADQAYADAMNRFETWEERMMKEVEEIAGLMKAENFPDRR